VPKPTQAGQANIIQTRHLLLVDDQSALVTTQWWTKIGHKSVTNMKIYLDVYAYINLDVYAFINLDVYVYIS